MLDRVIILHDNSRSHIETSVTTVFQKYNWKVLNHPPYSLHLNPLDDNLFPKLKELLREIRFSKLKWAVLTHDPRDLAA